ncbi:MAG: transporter substrate-binding protein [Blastococcus sp.]|jgi:NitT/TauT family transport system substrate-binding protein|nr:transporter substrate-binding protein [Blastococcus sp.]
MLHRLLPRRASRGYAPTTRTTAKSGMGAVLALALLTACGGADNAAESGSGEAAAQPLRTVSYGTISGSSSDAALFMGIEAGFFEEEGVEIEIVDFNSGALVVPPLATGDLDVGSGSPSAGLFNAVAQGVQIKIVAEKARVVPPGHMAFLVSKALVDSGEFQDVADLKGRTVALGGVGTVADRALAEWLAEGGLTVADVNVTQVAYGDQIAALQNGSIAAAVGLEPSVSTAVAKGAAVRWGGSTDVVPGTQVASAILFNEAFATDERDLATDFLRAYVRSVRAYNDALEPDTGSLVGDKGEEVANILTKYTNVTDPAAFLSTPLHGVDPNARPSVEGIEADFDYWTKAGLIKGEVTVEDALDLSLLEEVLDDLGPYERAAE